jgi:hypothetical protein
MPRGRVSYRAAVRDGYRGQRREDRVEPFCGEVVAGGKGHDNRLIDAKLDKRLPNESRLSGSGPDRLPRPFAVPEAGPVKSNDGLRSASPDSSASALSSSAAFSSHPKGSTCLREAHLTLGNLQRLKHPVFIVG